MQYSAYHLKHERSGTRLIGAVTKTCDTSDPIFDSKTPLVYVQIFGRFAAISKHCTTISWASINSDIPVSHQLFRLLRLATDGPKFRSVRQSAEVQVQNRARKRSQSRLVEKWWPWNPHRRRTNGWKSAVSGSNGVWKVFSQSMSLWATKIWNIITFVSLCPVWEFNFSRGNWGNM